jgi:hypothetical protein
VASGRPEAYDCPICALGTLGESEKAAPAVPVSAMQPRGSKPLPLRLLSGHNLYPVLGAGCAASGVGSDLDVVFVDRCFRVGHTSVPMNLGHLIGDPLRQFFSGVASIEVLGYILKAIEGDDAMWDRPLF